ncbi:hypothetical protein B0H11DRAFT_1942807 [Mycena galericulata]|nr:hypothetical protein B0H11DRAFT_1942807 [Mycena galericulata]
MASTLRPKVNFLFKYLRSIVLYSLFWNIWFKICGPSAGWPEYLAQIIDLRPISGLSAGPGDHSLPPVKAAVRPGLRIISPVGADLAADAISSDGLPCVGVQRLRACGHRWRGWCSVRSVLSPWDVVIVKRRDHIAWLVERKRYEALLVVHQLEADGHGDGGDAVSAVELGQRYIEHLLNDVNYHKGGRQCRKAIAGLAVYATSIVFGRLYTSPRLYTFPSLHRDAPTAPSASSSASKFWRMGLRQTDNQTFIRFFKFPSPHTASASL